MNTTPTFEVTPEVLAKSSLIRFIDGANFKHAWTMIFTVARPEFNMNANAVLERVEPHLVAPFTARAHFTINRVADGVPYGFVEPTKLEVPRTVLIKQITASEIVRRHGVGGRIFAGVTENPMRTAALIDRLNELYDLNMDVSDVLDQEILEGASCIQFRFHPKSVAFTGAFLLDLYTPIDAIPAV